MRDTQAREVNLCSKKTTSLESYLRFLRYIKKVVSLPCQGMLRQISANLKHRVSTSSKQETGSKQHLLVMIVDIYV